MWARDSKAWAGSTFTKGETMTVEDMNYTEDGVVAVTAGGTYVIPVMDAGDEVEDPFAGRLWQNLLQQRWRIRRKTAIAPGETRCCWTRSSSIFSCSKPADGLAWSGSVVLG